MSRVRSATGPRGRPMVEAHGLEKRYGDVRALAGLDLTVPEGSVLGLLGPNGAGKTTAVSILTTLLRADGGRATVAGHDVPPLRRPSVPTSDCQGSTPRSTSTSPATRTSS